MTVLSVPAAKAHLMISEPVDDQMIQGYIDSAVAAIGALVGPLEPTAVTERVRTTNPASLMLSKTPALSITSITAVPASFGGAVDAGSLILDGPAGVITVWAAAPFTAPYYDVVYQAGRATCPADLVMAVKELIRDQWSATKRGGRGPSPRPADKAANTVVGAENTMPFQVSRLIAPYLLSGFA